MVPVSVPVCRDDVLCSPDYDWTIPVNVSVCRDDCCLFPDDGWTFPTSVPLFRDEVFCSRTMTGRSRSVFLRAATILFCARTMDG